MNVDKKLPLHCSLDELLEGGVEAGFPPWGVQKCREAFDATIKNIKWLKESGATIAAGTDFGGSRLMRMGTNALELELLVKYSGFTPMEAITAATINGAKACAMEEKIGSIEEGKTADLIIVDGNPLEDIKRLQDTNRIKIVIKEGTIAVDRGL